MRTVKNVYLLGLVAFLPISCKATESTPRSVCDDAAAFVAEEYKKYGSKSDTFLLAKTGHPRIYFRAVLESDLTAEEINELRSDSGVSRAVMASVSLAGDAPKLLSLIQAGFSADTVSNEGVPILVVAAQCGRANVVNDLLSAGANIYAHDPQNIDAAAAAILENSEAVVRTLIASGYRVDTGSESGRMTYKLAQSMHSGRYIKLLRIE